MRNLTYLGHGLLFWPVLTDIHCVLKCHLNIEIFWNECISLWRQKMPNIKSYPPRGSPKRFKSEWLEAFFFRFELILWQNYYIIWKKVKLNYFLPFWINFLNSVLISDSIISERNAEGFLKESFFFNGATTKGGIVFSKTVAVPSPSGACDLRFLRPFDDGGGGGLLLVCFGVWLLLFLRLCVVFFGRGRRLLRLFFVLVLPRPSERCFTEIGVNVLSCTCAQRHRVWTHTLYRASAH